MNVESKMRERKFFAGSSVDQRILVNVSLALKICPKLQVRTSHFPEANELLDKY